MTLRRLTRAFRRRADIDKILAAYSAWRHECAAVRTAYGKWVRATTSDASVAFAAYRVALDREQRAADIYARCLRGAHCRPELDVAMQLTQLSIPFEAV